MYRQTLSAFFLVAVACGDGIANDEVGQQPAAPAAKAAPAAPAQAAAMSEATPAAAGAVQGVVKYAGEARPGETVDLSPDPYCVEQHGDEGMRMAGIEVGEQGGLRHAFVQLVDVPEADYETPEEPVVLDQVGCDYVPHVFGVMKKQDIEIRNSDATLHNIHPQPKRNKEFNRAMPKKGDMLKESFRKAEDSIPFKCDVHPWMRAFCFVMEHPYYATTNERGEFRIDTTGLPDGEYGVKVWHEELGEREGKVKVEGGSATFDLVFEVE